MKIEKIIGVFFSPVGKTKETVLGIAKEISYYLGKPLEQFNFTSPQSRQGVKEYSKTDFVVFGTPVYAGRIPNKLLSYVQNGFAGLGALALPVLTFGNRNFDIGLIELRNELEKNGFHTVAGAAVSTSHAFSEKISPNRPDEEDWESLRRFARLAAKKALNLEEIPQPVQVPGENTLTHYYTPLGADGKPVSFLKAKPQTKVDKCNHCGVCVAACPMGSIHKEDPSLVPGICIKCQACIQKCPSKAKYFDDEAFLSHVAMLEQNYTSRHENGLFI